MNIDINNEINIIKDNKNIELNVGMAKYMRNKFEFLSIQYKLRNQLQKTIFKLSKQSSEIQLINIVGLHSFYHKKENTLRHNYISQKKSM